MAKKAPNLRPSASKRWTSCPGSVSLIQSLVEDGTIKDESSSYADEGSLAHALAAKQLGKDVDYEQEWYDLYYCEEMQGYVDDYVDFVQADVPLEEVDHIILIEEPIPMWYAPDEPEGTADCVIVNKDAQHIHIKDLKYGMGVSVQAEDNTQLAIYARSFFEANAGILFDTEEESDWTFTLEIYQPRVIGEESVRQWNLSYVELEAFTRPIEAIASAHQNGVAEQTFNPSEDACRFCPAAAVCSAHADYLLGELPLDPREKGVSAMPKASVMSPDAVAKVVAIKSELVKWINKVEAHAKDMLMEGREVPGFQLVKTLKNRAWSDPAEAEKFLRGQGFKKDEVTPPSLVSPTQAEKMLQAKAKVKTVRKTTFEKFNSLAKREEGNPALATMDDKRDPFLPPTAEQEFGDDPSGLL